ncbi:MAG: ROK family protein [Alphaproteobacteria bacterium]|nr:ROK family protein [Alphaproteobacteria bacterium]
MRIGVDIGGTKIEAAAIDSAGNIVLRQRVPTPASDYAAAVEAIAGVVEAIEAEIGLHCPVGLGIPGTISPATGLVKNAPNSPFNGYPMDKDLERRLARPLRLMNDANCFALSEAVDGSGAGADSVFGVILGTGCGGGLVFDGEPVRGRNAIAGEWGHNPLPWPDAGELPGNRCNCGKNGCIETFLSGPGFAAHHNAATGEHLTAPEIADRAAAGDAAATASLRQYESRLARALASIINVVDPEIIVLGGGMSNVSGLYEAVPKLWGRWIFSDHVETRLVPPRFGDSSGVRGAAWLWPEDAGAQG